MWKMLQVKSISAWFMLFFNLLGIQKYQMWVLQQLQANITLLWITHTARDDIIHHDRWHIVQSFWDVSQRVFAHHWVRTAADTPSLEMMRRWELSSIQQLFQVRRNIINLFFTGLSDWSWKFSSLWWRPALSVNLLEAFHRTSHNLLH